MVNKQPNNPNGAAETFSLPVCVNCGNADLSVRRNLCAYCTVVHPERVDSVKCCNCYEFKAQSEFPSRDGQLESNMCFECHAEWDAATTASIPDRRRQTGQIIVPLVSETIH